MIRIPGNFASWTCKKDDETGRHYWEGWTDGDKQNTILEPGQPLPVDPAAWAVGTHISIHEPSRKPPDRTIEELERDFGSFKHIRDIYREFDRLCFEREVLKKPPIKPMQTTEAVALDRSRRGPWAHLCSRCKAQIPRGLFHKQSLNCHEWASEEGGNSIIYSGNNGCSVYLLLCEKCGPYVSTIAVANTYPMEKDDLPKIVDE